MGRTRRRPASSGTAGGAVRILARDARAAGGARLTAWTALGIDVAVRRGLDVVLLDCRRRLAAPPQRLPAPAALPAVLRQHRPTVVAVDAPSQWAVEGRSRTAERELRRLGLPCFSTPADVARRASPFYGWVHVGLDVFARLRDAGYRVADGRAPVAGCALEVFPHATAVLLRGARPPADWAARIAGKRAWRAEALAGAGVATDALRTLDQVDAGLAALTGLLALEGQVLWLGAARDGVLAVPAGACTPNG